jgi:hypothetical protein
MKVEQRLYTESEQIAIVEQDENSNFFIFLSIAEAFDSNKSNAKLYLTKNEAIELSNILKTMVDKTRTNSL